jgi:hypothetical protein
MKKRILSLFMLTICAAVPNVSANGGDVAGGAALGLVGGLTLGTLISQKRREVDYRREDVEAQERER